MYPSSTHRQPPMPPPGVPVRAGQYAQYSHAAYAPPGQYHDMTAAPSRSNSGHLGASQGYPAASPVPSFGSGYTSNGPLAASTRNNVKGSAPPRHFTSTPGSDRSPKEPEIVTPEEPYTAKLGLDDQFEHLLVGVQSLAPYVLTPGLAAGPSIRATEVCCRLAGCQNIHPPLVCQQQPRHSVLTGTASAQGSTKAEEKAINTLNAQKGFGHGPERYEPPPGPDLLCWRRRFHHRGHPFWCPTASRRTYPWPVDGYTT